jgi:molybdenum cofactor cytidylyltransferase
MKPRPAIIVLAAGRGTRFQGIANKLAQPLGRANVLELTLSNALATDLPLLVVTTPGLLDLVSQHMATRNILLMPEPGSAASRALGMGYSIAAGVAARSDASGWLVLPADMPLVHTRNLLAVAHALDEHPIAYAQHQGLRGHPIGFGAELYSELVRLTDDDGARRLVARYPSQGVEVEDPGVLLDIDTVEDLERAREMVATSVFGTMS